MTDEDHDFLREAARLLPPEPWDQTTWKTWTEALKQATDRKGKALFMPLPSGLDRPRPWPGTSPIAAADRPSKSDGPAHL